MSAMARVTLGQPADLDEADLHKRVDFMNSREDCADFEATRLLRALFLNQQHKDNPVFTPKQRKLVEQAVLDFKYWVDEPGHAKMISWTENHSMLFHSLEYLAGQYFPNKTFTNNGQTGKWHMGHAQPLLEQWIRYRAQYGFSEWDSNVYFEEDLTPLLNLADFAKDQRVRTLATMAVDMMLADMAFDHFYGLFPTSKGRTYVEWNKWPNRHPLLNLFKIVWGYGQFTDPTSYAAILLVTGGYVPPSVIQSIGMDMGQTYEHRERSGITKERALHELKWDPNDVDDMMRFICIGAMAEPETFAGMVKLINDHNLWETDFVSEAKPLKPVADKLPLHLIARHFPFEVHRTYLGEVNKLTWKTPDYMLSSAQDYHKGRPANQQMVWQATLAPNAFIHVNNPGALSDTERCPAYFGNDNRLPRVAQHKNVLVSVYRIPKVRLAGERGIYLFTHAYFPKQYFDEVTDEGPWTFARKDKGYLALYASRPKQWTTEGRDADREIVVKGDRVVWICQMGREADDGSFDQFRRAILDATVRVDPVTHNTVTYDAPGVGEIRFGWRGPFTVNGEEQQLDGFKRFENPFCVKEFGSLTMRVKKDGAKLDLDFGKVTRKVT